jgi:hypothetical protein
LECAIGPKCELITKWGNSTCEHCFVMYVSIFWTAKYERKSCLNWMVSLQALPRSQLIFPSKTWFFGIYLNFQQQKSLKNQYLPHSESKSYQINSIKSCSSRSFQEDQRHIPIPPKFSATTLFNFQWRNHSIFQNFCTASPNVMELSPCSPPRQELSKDTKNTIWSILVWWIS